MNKDPQTNRKSREILKKYNNKEKSNRRWFKNNNFTTQEGINNLKKTDAVCTITRLSFKVGEGISLGKASG